MTLAEEACEPCRGGIPPYTPEQIAALRDEVSAWTVVDHHHLERAFPFPDFATALAFVNAVGALAEEAGHHPDVELGWGRVALRWWSHEIDGLHRTDFILAARCDRLFEETPR